MSDQGEVPAHEFFPVAAGVAPGLLAYRVSSVRLRVLLIAVLSVLIGITAGVVRYAQARLARSSPRLR